MAKVIYRGARYYVQEKYWQVDNEYNGRSFGSFLIIDSFHMQPRVHVQQRRTAHRVWKALEMLNKNPKERV